jgi:orotate phosphoribosyltransferase
MNANGERTQLQQLISEKVILRRGDDVRIVSPTGGESQWLFDFRRVIFDPVVLDKITDLFWETYAEKYPFQVGGLETASIAITTAIVMKGLQRGTPVAGFYIRKSRKIIGLQKIIEGELNDHPVILVDDLINSGKTFLMQLEVLKKEHKKVTDIFTLVRFRDLADYAFAREENIVVTSPFTLTDFGLTAASPVQLPRHDIFNFEWLHQSPKPNYFYRVPKSAPILDKEKVYFGSDDGVMRALDQATGEERWKFKIYGLGAQGKTIFSSPALHNGMLYFGAYDGNFYALDAETGKKKWIYMDADWIGASPSVAPDLGLVYVGLEYGLWKKHGGIVALNHKTGEKVWEYIDMPSLTHGSPAYSKKFNAVAIGSNNGMLYFFRASDGKLLWQFQTQGDIKYIPTFDESGDMYYSDRLICICIFSM